MNKADTPTLLPGDTKKDPRGSLKFFNTFTLKRVVRFYEVKNSEKEPIRAFHGHMLEEKFIYVISGRVLVCLVRLTNTNKPSKKSLVKKYVLSETNPQILHIPAGYANGFKSLKKDSRIIFFSTLTLEKSLKDDYRFPYDYWGREVWKK